MVRLQLDFILVNVHQILYACFAYRGLICFVQQPVHSCCNFFRSSFVVYILVSMENQIGIFHHLTFLHHLSLAKLFVGHRGSGIPFLLFRDDRFGFVGLVSVLNPFSLTLLLIVYIPQLVLYHSVLQHCLEFKGVYLRVLFGQLQANPTSLVVERPFVLRFVLNLLNVHSLLEVVRHYRLWKFEILPPLKFKAKLLMAVNANDSPFIILPPC